MFRLLFVFFVLMGAAACNNAPENANTATVSTVPTVKLNDPLVQFSGEFSGNWPSANQGVALVNITFNTDSSFAYSEREPLVINSKEPAKVNRKAPLKYTGTYSMDSNAGKVKLYFLEPSMGTQVFQLDGDKLTKLDADSKPLQDAAYTLNRQTRVVSSIQNYLVSYHTAPFERFPVQVFLRAAGNNVRIHKSYLDIAPESEKALVAYYAAKYNTGCNENGCTLPQALGMDDEALKNVVLKWLPDAQSAKDLISNMKTPVERERLSMIYFIKTPKGIHVNYSLLDAKDVNLVGKDDFELDGNKWNWVKEEKPVLLTSKKNN